MVTSPLAWFSVSAQEGAHVSTNSFACSDPMDGAVGLKKYCSIGLSFLQGKDWFSYSTFFSIRGERLKYLFTYLFTLFWPELKPWFLQCASFLPLNRLYAFHWQSVSKPRFPPGSLQPNWCKLFLLRCLTIICHPMQARRQLPQQTQRHD